ncbi:type II secretion system protein [Solidesulfovibrio sp.]|uniref:type II secretion system protein n=1 Tax=Solidesulfovibrio sp. TaxID=2910990 RepID=UPI00260DC6FF|nr:type II secretion system protein [Solidesulfovibrio sp.]
MMHHSRAGFTLIEVIAVACLVAILFIAIIPKYNSMLDDSRRQIAKSLGAAAESQLSLEYSRRVITGTSLAVFSQDVCDMVSLSASSGNANIICLGSLSDEEISITATVDGQSINVNWVSPQSGS